MTLSDRLLHIGMYLAIRVPFAVLPLLANLLAWAVIPKQGAWSIFAVADLAYFAIMVCGELTLAGIVAPLCPKGKRGAFVAFALSPFVAFAAVFLLGRLDQGMVAPVANALILSGEFQFIEFSAACAVTAFVLALCASWACRTDPEAIPNVAEWLYGRLTFAMLPCAVNLATAFLSGNQHQRFRTSDICFFCIAIIGPAIIDLVQCPHKSRRIRAICTVPLVVLIVWSSVLLGFWYYFTAVPALTGLDVAGAIGALRVSVLICAAITLLMGIVVELLVSRAPSDLIVSEQLNDFNQIT